jgi:hypothetical protein
MDGGSAFVRRQVSDGDPRRVDVTCDLLSPFAISAVDNYRAALLGEHAGDALSDPAAAACDECATALELKIHSVPPLFRVCQSQTISVASIKIRQAGGPGIFPYGNMPRVLSSRSFNPNAA